jgi:phosphoribosylanthranilate isomerase
VDAFVEGYGGEGKRLELSWFEGVDCSRMILAGGLTAEILPQLHPYGFYGVDVSSGVEKAKGFKDHAKIREFIAAAKKTGC